MKVASGSKISWALVFLIVACSLSSSATAAPPQAAAITVKKLCPTCAKKIVKKLELVPGVSSASTNVEQRLIKVQFVSEKLPSPRLLWEMVEAGGEQPIRLEGPQGVFTAKPTF